MPSLETRLKTALTQIGLDIKSLGANFLPLTGGTVKGDIVVENGKTLRTLGTPEQGTQADVVCGNNSQVVFYRNGELESIFAGTANGSLLRHYSATSIFTELNLKNDVVLSNKRFQGQHTLEADDPQTLVSKSYVDGLMGGGSPSELATISGIAAGSTLGLEQALLAQAGQPGLTVLAVGYTHTGKVQGVSLGKGNMVIVYASGADYNEGNVLHREFMGFGEPICFTDIPIGAIITSTQGFYGFCEQVHGSSESPMPLLSYGLSFKQTFFYAFRNSEKHPDVQSDRQGWVHVVNGPLESTVKLLRGGNIVFGQEYTLAPWEYKRFYTDNNLEFVLDSTNPVMACINAHMTSDPSKTPGFYDSRLIMPVTNDGITWPRSGQVSSLFDGTVVNYYVRDGAKGILNEPNGGVLTSGIPVDFDSATVGTGADDADYAPDGATRVLAAGLISAYSGADGAGLEASPLMPTSAMSQIVAQPLYIADTGDGGNSSISVASPYEGEAKVYEWDDATNKLKSEPSYVIPLLRSIATNTQEDQLHPSAGQVANESVSGAVNLIGTLNAGVVIADVPITVVVQNGHPTSSNVTLRSQNGTTTLGIVNDDDETLSLGITPSHLKAEISQATDGLLYKRSIVGGSNVWTRA